MSNPKPIPLTVLKPLTTSTWKPDDYSVSKFAGLLQHHEKEDEDFGVTGRCLTSIKSSTQPKPYATLFGRRDIA